MSLGSKRGVYRHGLSGFKAGCRCGVCRGEKHRQGVRQHKNDRLWINSFKEKPCMDCGGIYDTECMDFDHREGETKAFNVGTARNLSKRRVMEEIAKCDLVCANCHRLRTKTRREAAEK